MAQKKTATAKSARKTVREPARKPAPLLAVVADKAPEVRVAPVVPVVPVAPVAPVAAPASVAKVLPRQVAKVSAKTPEKTPEKTQGKDFGDLAAVGQESFEACVKSGTIVAKGVETLGNEVMSFTQANIEADLAAARDIMSAKTLREAIDLQTDFAQARLERMTSETAKLGELYMRLASQAFEPFRSRFDTNTWTVFRSR